MRFLEFIAGLMAFWSILLTVIFRLEKRMVWPFGALEPGPQISDPNGYAVSHSGEAQRAGYRMLGWSRDLKFKAPIYYAILVSPDLATLAVIGSGMLGPIPLNATWLYTPTADGRTFYSTDSQQGVSIDVSKNWQNQLAFETTFTGLMQQHIGWLQLVGALPRKFREGHEMDDLRSVREEHFRAMERAGLIHYLDGSASEFQFTLPGAFRSATLGYLLGLSRRLTNGSFPRTA